MDLITLYKNPNFGFHKMAKQAIKAYVQKKPFLMAMPETIDITKKDFKSRYTIFIKLDKDIDKDTEYVLYVFRSKSFWLF